MFMLRIMLMFMRDYGLILMAYNILLPLVRVFEQLHPLTVLPKPLVFFEYIIVSISHTDAAVLVHTDTTHGELPLSI